MFSWSPRQLCKSMYQYRHQGLAPARGADPTMTGAVWFLPPSPMASSSKLLTWGKRGGKEPGFLSLSPLVKSGIRMDRAYRQHRLRSWGMGSPLHWIQQQGHIMEGGESSVTVCDGTNCLCFLCLLFIYIYTYVHTHTYTTSQASQAAFLIFSSVHLVRREVVSSQGCSPQWTTSHK